MGSKRSNTVSYFIETKFDFEMILGLVCPQKSTILTIKGSTYYRKHSVILYIKPTFIYLYGFAKPLLV